MICRAAGTCLAIVTIAGCSSSAGNSLADRDRDRQLADAKVVLDSAQPPAETLFVTRGDAEPTHWLRISLSNAGANPWTVELAPYEDPTGMLPITVQSDGRHFGSSAFVEVIEDGKPTRVCLMSSLSFNNWHPAGVIAHVIADDLQGGDLVQLDEMIPITWTTPRQVFTFPVGEVTVEILDEKPTETR